MLLFACRRVRVFGGLRLWAFLCHYGLWVSGMRIQEVRAPEVSLLFEVDADGDMSAMAGMLHQRRTVTDNGKCIL